MYNRRPGPSFKGSGTTGAAELRLRDIVCWDADVPGPALAWSIALDEEWLTGVGTILRLGGGGFISIMFSYDITYQQHRPGALGVRSKIRATVPYIGNHR